MKVNVSVNQEVREPKLEAKKTASRLGLPELCLPKDPASSSWVPNVAINFLRQRIPADFELRTSEDKSPLQWCTSCSLFPSSISQTGTKSIEERNKLKDIKKFKILVSWIQYTYTELLFSLVI